jgi:hypothetical protein
VYVHRDVPVSHELRARAATTLLPDAVLTGRSAAVLWGVDLAGPSDPVELTVSPASRQIRVAASSYGGRSSPPTSFGGGAASP